MEDRVGNSMSNRMCNSQWMGNGMSNWVGDCHRMCNSMSNWMSNKSWMCNCMGNRVSNNSSLYNSWSILRNSLISDILNDSIPIVSILNSLYPTIRKCYSITTRCNISIPVFRLF